MYNSMDITELNKKIESESAFVDLITNEIGKAIIGQKAMIERLMIGLLSDGHILLEGVPGLAKTLAISALAKTIDAGFSRIQFTPDLLPADVIGTMIYNPQNAGFVVKQGPVFSNFVLADEINRAPAKVQSALLEAMQERQVTIGDNTYKLDNPFLVLATQNPIEQEGTYPLPEAQLDRFMLKVVVSYPSIEEERQILHQKLQTTQPVISKVVNTAQIERAKEVVKQVYLDPKIENYITDIVFASRYPENYKLEKIKPFIAYGASPRASINLALAGRAYAFIHRRGYVIPEDIIAVCPDVLRHRIGLTYEAEAESIASTDIINEIINRVDVP
ncbi:MAG: MoxR family ATPase [Bacteroidales bacterium]|nr:MoxR family ATPase [Bacteroidales bacterium]